MPTRAGILSIEDKKKQKAELKIKNLEKLFQQKREEMLGEEIGIRQEIAFGHDVNERDLTTGRTVLCEAISKGFFHIVRILVINYNADVNIKTIIAKLSPLHLAVIGGYRQIASMLITYGANIHATDSKGNTALHYVNKLSLAKLLSKYSVDPVVKNNSGFTPLSYYLETTDSTNKNQELITFLTKKESDKYLELTRLMVAKSNNRKRDNNKEINLSKTFNNLKLIKSRDDNDDDDDNDD